MTVVKINAIVVAEGAGPELERRFAARAAEVHGARGFLGYELLRPVVGSTYFSVSRWETEDDFRAFVKSAAEDVRNGGWRGSAATGAALLEFEVV